MAVTTRVRRLANPYKRKARKTSLKRNSKGRFVKRSKASRPRRKKRTLKLRRRRVTNPVRKRVKASRRRATVTRKRRRKATAAPRRRVKATRKRTIRRRRANPATLLTLGAVNPQPRRKSVARRKRRNSTTTRRRRRTRNPRRVAVRTVRRRRVSRRRRNPAVFGSRLGSSGSLQMIFGGLLGVTAAKMLPTFLPASFVATPIMRILATGVSAYVASMVAGKMMSGPFADSVMFGGLMQTGSVALNTFVPSIGRQIGLAGMGDLVPGAFPVPQNPILAGIPAPTPKANINMNGLSRAFPSAF